LFAAIIETDKLFHIFTTLTEKEYFIKLWWVLELASFKLCPVVTLSRWSSNCKLMFLQ